MVDNNWNFDSAVNAYYTFPEKYDVAPEVDIQKIEALFKNYEGESLKSNCCDPIFDYFIEEGYILEDGIIKLCSDLDIDPNDISDTRSFILMWKLNATNYAEVSKEEFVSALEKLGYDFFDMLIYKVNIFSVDTIEGIKDVVTKTQKSTTEDVNQFKVFYNFCFDYVRGTEKKSISMDEAKILWNVTLGPRYRYLDMWIEFLTKHNKGRNITKDTWSLFFEFTRLVDESLEDYDPDGAWPTLIDEFVEYAKPIINGNK